MKKRGWYFIHALTGVHLATPTHYLDWSMMSASFPAHVAKVQEKLPSKNLKPVQSKSGTTTVMFRATEIRQVRGLSPYNEFIAEIHFEEVGEVRRCHVRAEGKDIITLEVKKLITEPPSWNWYLYGVRDGQLLRILVQIQGQKGITDVRGGASYTLGDHPIAEELRSQQLDNVSIAHEYAPQLHSLLNRPDEGLPL
jgi:hypothetical protein